MPLPWCKRRCSIWCGARPIQARKLHERGYRGAALDFDAPIGEPQANGAYRRMLADEATRCGARTAPGRDLAEPTRLPASPRVAKSHSLRAGGRKPSRVSRTGRSRNRPVRAPVSQIRGHPCAEAGKAFNKQALRAGSVARSPGRGRCRSSPRVKQERARRVNWAGSIRLCGLGRAFGVILHRRPLGRGAARMTVAFGSIADSGAASGHNRCTLSSGIS